MDIRIEPSRLTGSVRAISSKSDAHRLLICAALADRETVIERVDWSEDIGATARCLAAVSYTHLDVYKRQAHSLCLRELPLKNGFRRLRSTCFSPE